MFLKRGSGLNGLQCLGWVDMLRFQHMRSANSHMRRAHSKTMDYASCSRPLLNNAKNEYQCFFLSSSHARSASKSSYLCKRRDVWTCHGSIALFFMDVVRKVQTASFTSNQQKRNTTMKKTLLLLALCAGTLSTYAQDDDVYFVPSSKHKTQTTDSYTADPSSYTEIGGAEQQTYQSSHWADHRGNGNWDVDSYNRRGRNYRGQAYSDTTTAQRSVTSQRQSYDDGYNDGYEDGYYTSRLVRFWSPRVGVYVSSPFYMDYYDLCYDPFYYGYASPWYGWGWSGWYGWGSWYGWRPYYSSWYGWGWHGWYDPWWGPSYAWRPRDWWYPSNAHKGPVGGYVAYGGSRGTGTSNGSYRNTYRPSRSFSSGMNRGNSNRRENYAGSTRPSRQFGTQPSRQTDMQRPSSLQREQSRPSRSFGNSSNQSAPSRSFSTPSRSNSGSFGGGGGRSFGGGGGGRSFGGRR